MRQISDDEYLDFAADNPVVLLDFSATWCAPCQTMLKTLEGMIEKYPNIAFAKVDIDLCYALTDKFGVRSIPTLLLVKNGEVVDTLTGAQSVARIESFLNKG